MFIGSLYKTGRTWLVYSAAEIWTRLNDLERNSDNFKIVFFGIYFAPVPLVTREPNMIYK